MDKYTFVRKYTENVYWNSVRWDINDISLSTGGVSQLVERFMNTNPLESCRSITIYNDTGDSIHVFCRTEEMPKIVECIYRLEKATLRYIERNEHTFGGRNDYQVGMSLNIGKIVFNGGFYVYREIVFDCDPYIYRNSILIDRDDFSIIPLSVRCE